MPVSRLLRLASSIVLMGLCGLLVATPRILARPAATTLPGNSIPSVASPPLPSPVPQGIPSPAEQFGHVVGADRKLVRWDGIVDYLRIVGSASDRVNVHEIGPTTQGRPFLLLEISSADTIANLDHYKQLQQRLYFQDHLPGQDPDQVHTPEQRRELIEDHKAVVLITCSIHATEVGAAQMSLELVYHLATDNSPQTRKILDNVIFLLVPSLNPDGQGMVTDWYNRHVGTDFEAGSMPWLYHPYVGHDNNRDAYMYTQQETRLIGQVLYKDWFPSIWLDEHQMGSTGPRIFVMPATDPININVHPLIYRLNGIYGQAQGAALEAAGKVGIIYDYTYTNFWEGAMAWTGWWHNQVGMLTEMASVRIATPTEQRTAPLGLSPSAQGGRRRGGFGQRNPDEPLPAPRDTLARTTYPRPWLGGTWTLRDIVEYELIASLGLLETAADTRRQLNEQIYEINRTTIAQFLKGQGGEEESGAESGQGEGGGSRQQGRRGQGGASQGKGYGPTPAAIEAQRADSGRVLAGFDGAGGTPYGIIVATDQHDPIAVAKMLQALERGGVIVERASADFEAGGKPYAAGTYVIRLAQVFGRYAKDMLEAQTYPEVRLAPGLPPQPPYDVTAWSLGMMMGVETTFVDAPFEALLEVVDEVPLPSGRLRGRGDTFLIDAVTNASFAAINRLWGERTRIRRATTPFEASGRDGAGSWQHRFAAGTWVIDRARRQQIEPIAAELGLTVYALGRAPAVGMNPVRRPRIGIYQPWGSNMDEGWTRWLLDQYGFDYTVLHAQDFRAAGAGAAVGAQEELEIDAESRAPWPSHVAAHAAAEVARSPLAERFDLIVFAHQGGDSIVDGSSAKTTPPVYRGGIGESGLAALRAFLDAGGSIVAMGSATELFIDRWPIPVHNLAGDLGSDDFLIPGSIVNIQIDTSNPLGWGMPAQSYGYFIRSPFFSLTEGFRSQSASVVVRYPNAKLRASGWLRGEAHLAGRAAVVEVALAPAGGAERGRLVLLGLRPQHRAQTQATFKLLFNALVR